MPLITCPDCGKDVSTSAEACPNCGHPFKIQPTQNTVVTPTPTNDNSVPKWIVFPVIILGIILLFLLIYMLSGGNKNAGNENVNVDVTTQRPDSIPTNTTQVETAPTVQESSESIPPLTIDTPIDDNQQIIPTDTQTQVVENKGKVELEAKVADKNGKVTTVNNEKFYLLDKDLESILREANLQGIQNQNLVNSFGLSVLNPDQYKEFNQKALDAINDHIKYNALTSSGGKASLNDVEPKSYYLFGIHKVGNGFAIWNSPVNIKPGQNTLKIEPKRTTEINQE